MTNNYEVPIKYLFLVLFSASSFASQETEFRSRIKCESRQAVQSLISDVQKISEDESQATFRFVMSYGLCGDDEFSPIDIKLQRRTVSLTKSGFLLPFMSPTHVLEYEAIDSGHLSVTLSLQKSKKKFIMEFWPQNWIGFSYVLNLKSQADELNLDVTGFEPL